MSEFDPKRLTQRMTTHLNGGSEWSALHYEIHADGVFTGITRHVRTDGSPDYRKTADELHFGSETFDMLKRREVGGEETDPLKWLMERIDREPPA